MLTGKLITHFPDLGLINLWSNRYTVKGLINLWSKRYRNMNRCMVYLSIDLLKSVNRER